MSEKIVIPLDGSKVGEAALPYILQLVSKLSPKVKVEIILVQVLSPLPYPVVSGYEVAVIPYSAEDIELARQKAMKYLNDTADALRSKSKRVMVRVETRVGGKAAGEIVKISEEMKADLIAMSTHGRSGLSRWAFGSITGEVLRLGGSVPVVIVKAQKQTEKA